MTTRATSLRLALSASAIALFALPGSASAATCVWNGGAGNWSPAGGWGGCAVPASIDDVNILIGGSVVNISGINANAATVNLGSGNALNITNSNLNIFGNAFTNNGTVTLGGAAGLAQIINNNPTTLAFTGTGTIALSNIGGANARIYGGRMSFGAGHSLVGTGSLGINQTVVSNSGLISANVSGSDFVIDVSGGSGGVGAGNGFGTGGNAGLFNTGVMQATGGGSLTFAGGRYENSATGVIQALNGSVVTLDGDSRIVGGTLTSVGTGVIRAHSTTQYLTDVTLSSGSNLTVRNNSLYLNNTFTNNGTVTVGGIAGLSQLINESASLTLSGTGTIVLDQSVAGSTARIFGGRIIFGSNQLLTGSGSLGINQTIVTNNNLFSANSGSNLSIDVSGGNGGVGLNNGVGTNNASGLLNNSIMEATGGSTISFEGGLYENAVGGIIRATNNSFINLNGDSRILNGTLTSDASSVIQAHGTTQYLTNASLSAGSNLTVKNNSLYLNTTLTNNGTITVGAIAGLSQLINETANLAINGTGTIILDNSLGTARIYGGNITFGAGQTVQGAGDLGINQTLFTINNVFSANAGSTLNFDVTAGSGGVGVNNGVGTNLASGLLNNSTIQSTGGSTINLGGGLYENSATGVIQALNGSVVNLGGDSRVLNGTLTSVGTGVIQAHGTTQYLTDVTLSSGSNLTVRNNTLNLNTSFTNNGTVTVGGIAGLSQLVNENALLTLSGTGTIVLDNSLGTARIYGGRIIFGSNQLLIGSGSLGINQTIVTNNNLFSANSGSNLSIDVSAGSGGVGLNNGVGTNNASGLLNNSIMEATGGSTISFEGGLYENAVGGIIRATNNSFINLNGDSRILNGTLTSDASSVIQAHGTTQYLTNASLSAGSNLTVKNDSLYLNTTLTNNGTITVGAIAGLSQLINETANLAINGTGTIILDNSVAGSTTRIYGGNVTVGAGQTVRGSGGLGINQTVFTNNGLISADAGTGISIDVTGGSGGTAGGVGTGGNNGLLNNGNIQGANGETLSLEGGRYENSVTGTFGATGAGSVFVMNGDANLINLQAGNVLKLGSYVSSTTGAASTLNIRGTGANSISTIGTASAGTDTIVTLSGTNSVFNVTNFGTGAQTTLDSTLTAVAQSGRLNVLGGRNLTIVAGGGAFTNAGVVQLGGGTFGSVSYANSGMTTGFGTIVAPISNTGTVVAAGGVLSTSTIAGASGVMRSLAGATLDISGGAANSTAGLLDINGSLALGTRNVTVTNDYFNASFGSGNAFNNHANVTGTGLINAVSATMDLSGAALSGNVLNVGNVRTGGSSSTTFTITNNGTATNLIGAVKNTSAPSVALTGADWTAAANGGSANVGVSFTGLAAGSLAGQTLGVFNNFDNVASQTIVLAGNIYQVAQAGSLPTSLTLGARRVGEAAAIAGFSIANVAPVTPGFNEDLRAVSSVGSGFTLDGLATQTSVVDAGNSQAITLSHGTATAGAFSSTVSIANTSLAVAGSGLTDLPLTGQSISVIGNVYAAAVASLSGNTVNFGVVRQGSASPIGTIGVTNSASGALTDTLVTTSSGLPAGVTGTAPVALAAGQSSNANFALNTATAGIVNGTGSLNFTSANGEMADLALASQTVNFTGTITELASASIFKNAGLGILAGGGNAFTLDLGSLASNSGIVSTDLGVSNLLVPSAFAELLGGSFTQGGGLGYSFAGNSFSNLAGGASNIGNLLSFDTTGMADGTYTKLVTFNGYSSYAGLNDFNLAPINVSITATVTGNVNPAVPEPTTWMMMLFGFGLAGLSLRRNKLAVGQLA